MNQIVRALEAFQEQEVQAFVEYVRLVTKGSRLTTRLSREGFVLAEIGQWISVPHVVLHDQELGKAEPNRAPKKARRGWTVFGDLERSPDVPRQH